MKWHLERVQLSNDGVVWIDVDTKAVTVNPDTEEFIVESRTYRNYRVTASTSGWLWLCPRCGYVHSGTTSSCPCGGTPAPTVLSNFHHPSLDVYRNCPVCTTPVKEGALCVQCAQRDIQEHQQPRQDTASSRPFVRCAAGCPYPYGDCTCGAQKG